MQQSSKQIILAGWLALVVFVLITRFYGLAWRGISHDESLHAFYSWEYAEKGEYKHNPMMHGPLLFHLNALAYRLFGSSDFTARLIPALIGVLLILSFYPFKRYLGHSGALLAAWLAGIAPDLMFYSRYIRNDIYIAFLMMLWVYAIFRYLERPAKRWLFLLAGATALSFACKEVSFMHATIIAVFLAAITVVDLFRKKPLWDIPAADILLFSSTLILPFACPLLHYILGWNPLDTTSAVGQRQTFILAGSLFLFGLLLILIWSWLLHRFAKTKRSPLLSWVIMALIFWGINFLLYTSLLTQLRMGAASGLAGSLGYWLAQHGEQRGSQPLFYYLMLILLYNASLFILILAAIYRSTANLIKKRIQPFNRAIAVSFFLWWVLSSFVLYTLAGERMPWLLIHISLPMCLLSGWWLRRFLKGIDWMAALKNRSILLIAIIPLLTWLLLNLPLSLPMRTGRTVTDIQQSIRWFRVSTAGMILLLILIGTWRKRSKGLWRQMLLCGLIATLTTGTLINALRLSFITYDLPTELLVYAHASDDVKPIFTAAKKLQINSASTNNPVIAYDATSAWPSCWYVRDIPHKYFVTPTADLLTCPIIICGKDTAQQVRELTAGTYHEEQKILKWWPLQGYHNLTFSKLSAVLSNPTQRAQLLDIILYRSYKTPLKTWPLRHDLHVFVRSDQTGINLTPSTSRPPPRHTSPENKKDYGSKRTIHPQHIYDTEYDGKKLFTPRSAVIAQNGNLVIADTGNNRIILLAPDGTLLQTIDPKESFNAPWGIAINANNHVFVADTWHGQIRIFSQTGNPITQWGTFAASASRTDTPNNLYGPRGISLNSIHNVLAVADTGNDRILLFKPSGSFIRSIGPFDEPVNVVFVPDNPQKVAIADLWNHRVVIFDLTDNSQTIIPIPFWYGQDANFKPFVAIDNQQRIYVTDPAHHCVAVFSEESGKPLYHFGTYGNGSTQMNQPTGLSISPDGKQLIVADSGNNRILLFDLSSTDVN